MRTALLLALLCATLAVDGSAPRGAVFDLASHALESGVADGVRLAGLSDTVPGLFLKLVNDKLKGTIKPRTIRYRAPASVILEDAVLLDPHGEPVARVKYGEATLTLSALLLGEIVISKITLDEPKLLLSLHDEGGERVLNLLEALTPKQMPDSKEPASGTFRIDAITATRGGFRFVDGENITVTADGISATATVDVDLLRKSVLVDVRNVRVAEGTVKLPELDVPITGLTGESVRVLTDRLDIRGVSARVAGARVDAWGSMGMKPPGDLGFSGTIRADADAWPDRLKRLPFHTPALNANVKVTGPYENPLVRVDGDFKRAELYGYVIDSGIAKVEITKDRVRILDGSLVRAGPGSARVDGTVALPSLDGDLQVRAKDVPMQTALLPAKLEPAPKGILDGKARIRGIFDGKAPLSIDANASARRLEITGVHAPGEVTADARIRVEGQKVTLERSDVRGPGAVGSVTGVIDSEARRLSLEVGATVDAPLSWIDDIPAELVATRGTFDGSVRGPFDAVVVTGAATVASGDAWGVPLSNVSADVNVEGGAVEVRRIRGQLASGSVEGITPFSLQTREPRRMAGSFSIQGADLALLKQPDGTPMPFAGRLDGEVILSGNTKAPRVAIRAAVGGGRIAGEELGEVVARGLITRERLTLDLLTVRGRLLTADASSFSLRFEDLALDARAQIDRLDLAALRAAEKAELSGTARGSLTVTGDARTPNLIARLDARDLRAGPQRFGSGAVRIGMIPDALKERGHVVHVSARLASEAGVYDAALSYALQREVMNLKASISDVDLGPYVARLGESVAPFQGFTSGVIEASGPLDSLTGRVTLRVPELAVPIADPGLGSGPVRTLPPLRPLGEMFVDVRLDDSELTGRLCAFPGGALDPEAPCSRGERVWASVSGAVDLAAASFDLAVDADVSEAAVEDLIPALASRGFQAGLRAHVAAQVSRPAATKAVPSPTVDVAAEATLLEGHVLSPGAPRADLKEPAQLTYLDKRVTLETPARFATESGDADLVLSGSAGTEDIDARIDGKAALALLKLFTKEIANASSTADIELKVSGKYAEGISLEGTVTPTPGAIITPRGLGESVTFMDGSLSVAPLGARLFRVTADGLRARIGDGDVQLRGSVDVRSAREDEQSWVSRYDLVATGNGVSVRRGEVRGEGSFDLILQGEEAAPVLRGRVEVAEGSFKKSFELRNFVLAAAPERKGDPLWQTLEPFGLANLDLDVALNLSNFRVLAKITTFSADMSLRGSMRLRRTLRFPQIDGAVEIEEGTVDFPRARFDVTEMQLEFPANADGRLSPVVHLAARAEIPPGGAGSNDTEIPVDLALDGSLEEGMRLDLTAIDPAREWSRSDLLGLVLFGKSLDSVGGGDANIAVRALLREASAPLTRELEEALLANFGVDVELDATGWRWQLGRRLELEGAGFLIETGSSNTATTSAQTTGAAGTASAASSGSSYATDVVRLRFLVLDHLPVGSNLSFESRAGLGGSEVRLSLRLFEN